MDRRQLIAGAAAGLAVAVVPARATAQIALPARARQLADAYAAAWNSSDMDAMAALYTDDVHWVNIVGMHWRGKAEVDRAHRALFDRVFRGVSIALQEVESVKSLPGGIGVAVLRWAVGAYRTPAGSEAPPSRNRMTLVLVPQDDRLLIAHGANIEINETAQRSNPIHAG